jgi:hypothetical protein
LEFNIFFDNHLDSTMCYFNEWPPVES